MAGYIAVHVGAGDHSASYHPVYKHWMKEACRKGQLILKEGGSAVDAVAAAIQELEACELTNTGYGSALTNKGTVECDAGIMDGGSLRHAGVAAVSGLKHPISAAHKLLALQSKPLLGNLVPPALLVGEGAVDWAAANGLRVCDESKLVSAKSLERHRYYLRQLRKLKHRQKKEKLALNQEATSKDRLGNSSYSSNNNNSQAANDPSHDKMPHSNVNNNNYNNITCTAGACLDASQVSHSCDLREAASNGKSRASDAVVRTRVAADEMLVDNCSIDGPARKDSTEDHGLKSASCDSNMETGDERQSVGGLIVHQGDSSSPLFNKGVESRSDHVRWKVGKGLSLEKLPSSEHNLNCQTNADNCKLDDCKNQQRNCENGDAVLSKLSNEETIKQEENPHACPSTRKRRFTEDYIRNARAREKRGVDVSDSSLYSNRCRKRAKTDCDTSTSASFAPQPSQSSTVQKTLQSVLDTVGCVAVSADGTVAAGASSGGILLKTPGRVGQSAILGAGYWAENCCKESRYNVAVCTSGCGEMLVSSQLAMRAAAAVADQAEADWADLPGPLNALMLENKFLQSYSRPKSSGCLILKHDPAGGSTDLYCCHTSVSFGYAYMGIEDRKPIAKFSTMNPEQEGQAVMMDCYSYFSRPCAEPKLNVQSDGLESSAVMPTWKILDPLTAESAQTTSSRQESAGVAQS